MQISKIFFVYIAKWSSGNVVPVYIFTDSRHFPFSPTKGTSDKKYKTYFFLLICFSMIQMLRKLI